MMGVEIVNTYGRLMQKTGEEIWSANYNEPGRGYSLGISNSHDGGLIFFGKKDTGRLKIFKTDENGIVISGQ